LAGKLTLKVGVKCLSLRQAEVVLSKFKFLGLYNLSLGLAGAAADTGEETNTELPGTVSRSEQQKLAVKLTIQVVLVGQAIELSLNHFGGLIVSDDIRRQLIFSFLHIFCDFGLGVDH